MVMKMMSAESRIFIILFVSLALFGTFFEVCNADADSLKLNFYNTTCPSAEKIVSDIIKNRTQTNPTLAAKLIRMHFHDCFVRGCDGSVLLDTVDNSSRAEKEAVPNQTLAGFDVIDDIKAAIEQACPNVVSCADILALAARDAVSASFNESLWEVLLGRRDGSISLSNETTGNLPPPSANFTTLVQIFNNKSLDVTDLVVLSGAHTIGVARCGTFTRRLYNFTGQGDADPSLDATYAETLRQLCPNPTTDPTITVEMDPGSALSFDKHYYEMLLQNKGLFVSDAALLTDNDSKTIVSQLQTSDKFLSAFAKSVKKMAAIEVLTGNAGEIRQNCRVVNPHISIKMNSGKKVMS